MAATRSTTRTRKTAPKATEPAPAPVETQPEPAKPEPTKPASKAPLIVTDADLNTLIYVAAHQKAPKFRHLDHCPHFEKDAKFTKATDEQAAALKPCPDCARNAARTRTAAA